MCVSSVSICPCILHRTVPDRDSRLRRSAAEDEGLCVLCRMCAIVMVINCM